VQYQVVAVFAVACDCPTTSGCLKLPRKISRITETHVKSLTRSADTDVPLFQYEDFVREPAAIACAMCEVLDIGYSKSFADTFDTFVFSGDSGRKGSVIKPRPRRQHKATFVQEAKESKHYWRLIERLGYEEVA